MTHIFEIYRVKDIKRRLLKKELVKNIKKRKRITSPCFEKSTLTNAEGIRTKILFFVLQHRSVMIDATYHAKTWDSSCFCDCQ